MPPKKDGGGQGRGQGGQGGQGQGQGGQGGQGRGQGGQGGQGRGQGGQSGQGRGQGGQGRGQGGQGRGQGGQGGGQGGQGRGQGGQRGGHGGQGGQGGQRGGHGGQGGDRPSQPGPNRQQDFPSLGGLSLQDQVAPRSSKPAWGLAAPAPAAPPPSQVQATQAPPSSQVQATQAPPPSQPQVQATQVPIGPTTVPAAHSVPRASVQPEQGQAFETWTPAKAQTEIGLLWDQKSDVCGSFAKPYKSIEDRKRNVGKLGRPINLLTNHFNMRVQCATVYRYDVEFTFPKFNRPVRKRDTDILVRAFEELKKKNARTVFKNGVYVVYDGRKNIYAPKQLNLGSNAASFEDTVSILEVPDIPDVIIEVKAKIQYIGALPIKDAIDAYEKSGSTQTKPQDEITALNVILSYMSKLRYECVGRNVFTHGEGSVQYLANGKSLWIGTFSSVRVGWKVRINIDVGNRPAYEEDSLINFMCEFLNVRNEDLEKELPRNLDFVSKELANLKVRFCRPDGHVRDYSVNKLMKGTSKDTFFPCTVPGTNQEIKVSVYDYFIQTYKKAPTRPNLPVLHVGAKQKTNYLPIEFLRLKRQACPISKKLKDDECAIMIRHTAVPPADRKNRILRNLKELSNGFVNDPYAKEFGLSVDGQMLAINGRVLDSPKLGYGGDAQRKPIPVEKVTPKDGKWNLRNETFKNGMSLQNWGILDLVNLHQAQKDEFVDVLFNEGAKRNLKIDFPIHKSSTERKMVQMVDDFKALLNSLERESEKKGPPQLIMVFVSSKNSSIYGEIKTIGDVICRITTQVILKKNVLPDFRNKTISPQTIHNICLKINSKLGGTNQIIHPESKPAIFNNPIMFIGADVTHAPPSDLGQKPSIAAVVGSYDPAASLYNSLVSVQTREGAMAEEKILDLENLIYSLLMKFYTFNKTRKPLRLIYYRDGVSEGQFEAIMNYEISAIQRACRRLEAGYEPGITFLVVQKRHNTRLFPQNPNNPQDTVGKMRNVPPGTVVDTEITHPTETSYFLVSHEGIQGTSRPTCYHLLYDDNGLTSDELQKISYYLCFLYSRCERSVSYPAPTYYAHLAAFRARYHHNVLCDRGQGTNKAEILKMEKFDIPNYFV